MFTNDIRSIIEIRIFTLWLKKTDFALNFNFKKAQVILKTTTFLNFTTMKKKKLNLEKKLKNVNRNKNSLNHKMSEGPKLSNYRQFHIKRTYTNVID